MSILSVNKLQGIASSNNKLNVPSGHELDIDGRFRLPSYPGNAKPNSPSVGELIINTDSATLEVWTGDRWANCGGGNRGGSQSNPAFSAKDAYEQGNQTSGNVWVTIPGSGAFQFEYDATDR